MPCTMRTASMGCSWFSRGRPAWRACRPRRWRRRRRGRRGGCGRPGLAPLEVAVARRRSARRGRACLVHGQAHRAARLPPVEPGGRQDRVEALGLRLGLDGVAARHDERADAGGHLAAVGHGGHRLQVLDAAVVQDPMNTVSTATSQRGAGGEAHVVEGPPGRITLGRVGEAAGSGTARDGRHLPCWCPTRRGGRCRPRRGPRPCRRRPSSVGQPVLDGPLPVTPGAWRRPA